MNDVHLAGEKDSKFDSSDAEIGVSEATLPLNKEHVHLPGGVRQHYH